MIRTPSTIRRAPCLATTNWRPLLVEITLIAFVSAAIFIAALVGMSAARVADAGPPGCSTAGVVDLRPATGLRTAAARCRSLPS
jgi:hypothetical protein